MYYALRARLAVQGSFKIAPGDFVNLLLRFKSSPGNNKQKNRQTAVLLFDGRGERIYSSHPWDSPCGLTSLREARSNVFLTHL